jgi:hypothetical protein
MGEGRSERQFPYPPFRNGEAWGSRFGQAIHKNQSSGRAPKKLHSPSAPGLVMIIIVRPVAFPTRRCMVVVIAGVPSHRFAFAGAAPALIPPSGCNRLFTSIDPTESKIYKRSA